MKLNILILLSLLFPITGNITAESKSRMPQANKKYVVVANSLDKEHPSQPQKHRYISIYVKSRYFTEKNLKYIFREISGRFPQTTTLTISAYDNYKFILIDTDKSKPVIIVTDSSGNETQVSPQIAQETKPVKRAIYIREEGGETFRF